MPATPLEDLGLLTLADVAALLHCSKAHVCNVVAGRVRGCPPIPSVSLGRRKLVRRDTLLSWIENNEQAAADDNVGRVANDNVKASPERGRKSA
jgi:hypothetical protein